MGIHDGADGNAVVDRGHDIGHILGAVHFDEPGLLLQFRVHIGEVGAENAVDQPFGIGFVKGGEAGSEEGVGGGGEEAAGLVLMHIPGDIQHALPRGDDIVGHQHAFPFHALAQVLVGHDGVAAVDHAGIVPPLVEHAQVHAQHRGIVHIPVHGALVRAHHHEAFLVGIDVREFAEHGLQHLVVGHQVVETHEGHRVLHPVVVGVEGDDVVHAHGLQLLQGAGAVQALPRAAAVLPPAVKLGHDDGDGASLAAHGLDDPGQVGKVVVRAHAVFIAEKLIGAAVVVDVGDDVDIHAADAVVKQGFRVAGLEAGALGGEHKGVPRFGAHGGPLHQPMVDLRGQVFGAGQRDEAQLGKMIPRVKQLFSFHILFFPQKRNFQV